MALAALIGCSPRPYPRDQVALARRDPFAVVARADELTKGGRYDEALREYLWALDHGVEVNKSFEGARASSLLDALLDLAAAYPAAKAALQERSEELAHQIVRAAEGGPGMDEMVLTLFVRLGTRLDDEGVILTTYGFVKKRLPPNAKLRRDLWVRIEEFLVEQRRYRETVDEQGVGLAAIRYYVATFQRVRAEDEKKYPVLHHAIEFTIEHEGAVHFEALLGAGESAAAESFAEELIQFRPSGHTFASLIKHALRAGGQDEATRLKTKADGVVPEAERKCVDEAMNEAKTEAH